MASTKTKAGAVAAAVVAAAAGLYVATTDSTKYAGACVSTSGECMTMNHFIGGKCPGDWKPVISCENQTPADYKPKATPVPTPAAEILCFASTTGECRTLSSFGSDRKTCPLGFVKVSACPPALPVPTMPVPPVSGPPRPIPTAVPPYNAPWASGIGNVQLIQGKNGAILVVDGAVVRTWGASGLPGHNWQTNFSWTVVPTISGGS